MARPTRRAERYLRHCRERIESARRFRKEEGLDELWDRLVDLYAGKQYPKSASRDDRLVINIAFSTINVIGPSVSINNPKITVNARSQEDADRALITECLMNYWWRHLDIHDEFRLAVNDFLILGFGWLKTGYRYVEENQDDPEGYQEELDAAEADVDSFATQNPHLAASLPTPEEVAANVPSTRLVVVEDRPFAQRVSTKDIFVDPEATSMRDAQWIAERNIRSLAEVVKDKSYDAKARRDVKADGRADERIRPADTNDHRDPNWQRVTVWEFYDLKEGTVCTFAEEGDGFLVEPQQQPYAFGHPYVMLRNYDVPDVFYPMGELEALEPIQHELNETRTAMMNDRRSFKRAHLYNEAAFDKKGKAALESKDDNRLIPVSGNVPLTDAVAALPGQTPNPEMYRYSDQIEHDANSVTALDEYTRGELPEIRRTATEASIIKDAANSRAADKLAKVEKVIAVVARRLIQLAEQYMTEPEAVRIAGREGPLFFQVQPEDIAGEFDFDVEGGSTQPLNESGRRQQATNLLGAIGPMLVPGGPINVPEFLRYLLRDGYGIKDPSRFIVTPPAPVDPSALPAEGGDPNAAAPAADGAVPPELLAQLGTA